MMSRRLQKEETVQEVQSALHSLVDTATSNELRQTLHALLDQHNHLTCMYCSVSPEDCDFMGLAKEGLTVTQSVPESLSALDSSRLCKQCRQHLDEIEGLFCSDCQEV